MFSAPTAGLRKCFSVNFKCDGRKTRAHFAEAKSTGSGSGYHFFCIITNYVSTFHNKIYCYAQRK